jgi:cobalt-precorrin 5A hydrolase
LYLPAQIKCAGRGEYHHLCRFEEGLVKLTEEIFHRYEGLVYVMPLGVVIRAIASQIRSKHTDPAVVAVDVAGRYVISALSGHEGGANELAERCARSLNTEFVVTTSTEALKDLIIGIGCRRGASKNEIEEAVNQAVRTIGCTIERIRLVATVDRKREEPGLVVFCAERKIPLRSISTQEIRESRIRYRESPVVRRALGIGGVAVPCALLGGKKTTLVMEKKVCGKVTIAASLENFDW